MKRDPWTAKSKKVSRQPSGVERTACMLTPDKISFILDKAGCLYSALAFIRRYKDSLYQSHPMEDEACWISIEILERIQEREREKDGVESTVTRSRLHTVPKAPRLAVPSNGSDASKHMAGLARVRMSRGYNTSHNAPLSRYTSFYAFLMNYKHPPTFQLLSGVINTSRYAVFRPLPPEWFVI